MNDELSLLVAKQTVTAELLIAIGYYKVTHLRFNSLPMMMDASATLKDLLHPDIIAAMQPLSAYERGQFLIQLSDALLERVVQGTGVSVSSSKGTDPKSISEAKLREWLSALRFPEVEDVYSATSSCFYVTFAVLLTPTQLREATAFQLSIERTYPLRNRYLIVFTPTDTDEV